MAKRTGNRGAPTKGSTPTIPKVSAALDGGVEGANRRERKEEARRQREALLRKQHMRKRMRVWGLGGTAAVAVVALVLFLVLKPGGSTSSATKPTWPANLPGLITSTDTGQWTANTQDLSGRVSALKLPALSASEQLKFHVHQHIDIYIDGAAITVPAGIGIDQTAQRIAVIHVHSPDGIIHVESPTVRDYWLGDLFGVWGLQLTPTCIGGYCNAGDKTLQVYVNGKLVTGDPRDVVLKPHLEIVVAYGTPAELPNPIPASYAFPSGV